MRTTYEIDVEKAATELDREAEQKTPSPDRGHYPDCLIKTTQKQRDVLCIWLDQWLDELDSALEAKRQQWADEERAYRAKSDGIQTEPFVGASGDHVPLIAMAVDPIVARLDTGIFKNAPIMRMKALRKSMQGFVDPLEQFVEYYQKHKIALRSVALPRINELAKHGTMVFKVVYDCTEYTTRTYDANWKVVNKQFTEFEGPRIVGVPLSNFLFPAHHQHVQDCPIVGERLRLTMEQLRILEASGKITNVDALIGQEETNALNTLEEEQANSVNHRTTQFSQRWFDIRELWFDYDMDGDGIVEHYVCTYHRPTRTMLQLRYNWFFHQKKPYVVIPYTVSNDSLYGIGIAEMVLPMQDALTQWQRHALNNAYLANIRMYAVQKDAKIEQRPRLFGGRVFYLQDPSKDFIPINAAADTYPSTLTERQNLVGFAEKRTGVSDYLTGRESPIVGSRATATSTIALIQEGTRRVEEVMENIRLGFAEMWEMCFSLWIQYGLGDIDDIVFSDDNIGTKINEFFDSMSQRNVNGCVAIELAATDASNNRTVQQQAQLAIIQTMMVYLEKTIQAGQTAVQAMATAPQLAELIGEIMGSARKMYSELLTKYEIPNPEEYLPDLTSFLTAMGIGAQGNTTPGAGSSGSEPNLSALNPTVPGVQEF